MDCNSVDKKDIGFCSCFPCGVDEGPCTFDNECKDDLHCGYKNCPSSFDTNDNCCTKNDLLKSPNFPNPYPINVEETWLLTAHEGSIIILQFHFFDVRLIAIIKISYEKYLYWPCPHDDNRNVI